MTRKEQADDILYRRGLLDILKPYGTPHIIGSYRMDLMAWNDLDIDIENNEMSLEKLYRLSNSILHRFRPVWYEAKETENEERNHVWFHGFETLVEGELWNIDLWFFDKKTIFQAEAYCDAVSAHVKETPAMKDMIIDLKKALIAKQLYTFEQFTSMDVYDAVLHQHLYTVEDFLAHYTRR